MGNQQQTPSDKNAENVAEATTPTDDDTDVEGFAVFAKFDGIDGESKDGAHGRWIDVLNVDWGASQHGLPTIGEVGLRKP